jgi:hypothetical protein
VIVGWEVELVGDDTDLELLAERFTEGDIVVSRQDTGLVLSGHVFDNCHDAEGARKLTDTVVAALSSVVRIQLSSPHPIRPGRLHSIDEHGIRGSFFFAGPAVIHVRALPPTFIMTSPDGTKKMYHPADSIKTWLTVATKDETVMKALRLAGYPDRSWVELYRIYELIEGDAGGSMYTKGWTTKRETGSFTHTANSPSATGDLSRHGKERTTGPADHMTLSEATEFVDRLLAKWLDDKSAHP